MNNVKFVQPDDEQTILLLTTDLLENPSSLSNTNIWLHTTAHNQVQCIHQLLLSSTGPYTHMTYEEREGEGKSWGREGEREGREMARDISSHFIFVDNVSLYRSHILILFH